MRGPHRTYLICALALCVLLLVSGCGPGEGVAVPGHEGAVKTAASVRAERRAYDGAPPVVPHEAFGMACSSCHNDEGRAVAGVGFAPASPHGDTRGLGDRARCRQCHVFSTTDDVFRASAFEPLAQDLRPGSRLYPGAPPTMPHRVFMRETCTACHAGPAAREEIRTTHPERTRCRQCHVPSVAEGAFTPATGEGLIEAAPEE